MSAAIKNDGSLWKWRYNSSRGANDTITVYPTRVGTDNDWISVSLGDHHLMALAADGNLWAWGLDQLGQQAIGTYAGNYHPVRVEVPSAHLTPTLYTVVVNDSLWNIALSITGCGNRWPELYRLNQSYINSRGNADLIFPGQQLKVWFVYSLLRISISPDFRQLK